MAKVVAPYIEEDRENHFMTLNPRRRSVRTLKFEHRVFWPARSGPPAPKLFLIPVVALTRSSLPIFARDYNAAPLSSGYMEDLAALLSCKKAVFS